MSFRWPVHADLYVTRNEVRLIGKAASVSTPVRDDVAAAITLLAKQQPKVSQVTVWLGGDLVQYGVLAPVQGRLSEEDARKVVQTELGTSAIGTFAALSLGNTISREWRTAVHLPDVAGRRAWAAFDSAVEAEVCNALRAARIHINGLAPVLTRIAGSQVPSDKTSKLQLLLEAQTVTAVQFDQEGIVSIRQIETSTADLSAVLERLQVQTGVPVEQMMLVDLTGGHALDARSHTDAPAPEKLEGKLIADAALPPAWLRKAAT